MTREELESFITQFPIYQYAFVDPREIEFSDKVRMICKKECPRYGSTWSCPPAVGSVEKCKMKCQGYDHALFFSSVSDVTDIADMKDTLKTQEEHEKLTTVIDKYLRDQCMLSFALSSESCSVCEKCTYPKGPCRYPETMHPCIESQGIVVPSLIEKNMMDYFLGERYVLWFSIIFYKEA